MNVFDVEAEIADQETAGRWFLFAQAGCDLAQARAFAVFQGRGN